jgi:hypothetical protein
MKGLLIALCLISTLLIVFVGACPLLVSSEWVAIPIFLALVAWNPLLLLLLRNPRRNWFTMAVLIIAALIDCVAAVVCAVEAYAALVAQKGYVSFEIPGLLMLAGVVGFKGVATLVCVNRRPAKVNRGSFAACEQRNAADSQ